MDEDTMLVVVVRKQCANDAEAKQCSIAITAALASMADIKVTAQITIKLKESE